MEFADEMPEEWVRQLVAAIESYGHSVADAHESGITVDLTDEQARTLGAEGDDRLIIGWTERYGVDWGLGRAGHVPHPEGLDATAPEQIAAAVHALLTTGRPA